ncbi:DUF2637 domain-containing protein [Micromonospora globbae]|jgi:hypothetical protein|uniref:DUF2637 domain-containing protein n=1 Tax=Micromonospora globbae TaxID=1894969 RepID=A0A420F2X1_9ACTN|nr:DUF2637 domain-containing protein [Micromonospora globbae]RKF27324.1 DUF2637 domain-containing protein [Micromonospora globbae]
MTPTRLARDVSTVAVAGIAAWSSWSHMVAVALRFGERPEVAYVLPLSVDGMLVVASAAMVEDKRAERSVRWSARVAFVAGVAASVAANIAAAEPSPGARIVAAWPAVALLLVVEMLTKWQPPPRSNHRTSDAAHPQGPPAGNAASVPPPESDPPVSLTTEANGAQRAGITDGAATSQVPAPPRRRNVRRKRTTVRPEQTADAVARLRAERPQASPAELAVAAGVSERHVRRLIAGKPEHAALQADGSRR